MEHSVHGALGKKAFCQILKIWFITGQNVQRLQIFVILASYLSCSLKVEVTELSQDFIKLEKLTTKQGDNIFGNIRLSIGLCDNVSAAKRQLYLQLDNKEGHYFLLGLILSFISLQYFFTQLFFDETDDPYCDLVNMADQRWKRVRGISSPTFSGKRMKQVRYKKSTFLFGSRANLKTMYLANIT